MQEEVNGVAEGGRDLRRQGCAPAARGSWPEFWLLHGLQPAAPNTAAGRLPCTHVLTLMPLRHVLSGRKTNCTSK